MSQKTVTINGRVYDVHTGMPLDDVVVSEVPVASSPKHSPLHHSKLHGAPQKSQTLNRRTVKKTVLHPVAAPSTPKEVKQEIKETKSISQKNPTITKFAPHPAVVRPRVMSDIAPVHPHPKLTKAHQTMQAQKQVAPQAPKPSSIIKQEAIKEALEKAPSKTDKQIKTKRTRRLPRFAGIASASLALLLLGSYFTYLNMPNLSVRVAAAQAGINASYPEYKPDGYSLHGPIGYNDGQVTMKFAANAGPQNYNVSQTKSSWDSSAVLDNYVKEKAGDNYITYNERGLTIYTFDGNAAWVNGGILYTINGDAPLSSDQIRRIAVSM